jgi:DNA relaxase NicK
MNLTILVARHKMVAQAAIVAEIVSLGVAMETMHPQIVAVVVAVEQVTLMALMERVAMVAQELFTSFILKHHWRGTSQVVVLSETSFVKNGTTQLIPKA